MTGILYGTGVGPGDPELMTLKSVRLIRENRVIALPGPVAAETIAYRIAVQAVPELASKTLLSIDMPMTHDRETMNRGHELAAREIEGYLKQGENVVFLTLGDPTIYSTYLYVQKRIAALNRLTKQQQMFLYTEVIGFITRYLDLSAAFETIEAVITELDYHQSAVNGNGVVTLPQSAYV